MQITNHQELEAAITRLKAREAEEKELLVEQFHATAESLKPVNIIKNAFRSISGSKVGAEVINAAVGVGAGLFSKNMLVGKSSNIIKKILGTVVEVGVANAVAINTDKLRSSGAKLFGGLIRRWRNRQQ
ncbi:MAG: hypothetical protein ABJA78_10620 [Ferruginibacter sp.]